MSKEPLPMHKVEAVLQCRSRNLSVRQIARSLGLKRSTVSDYLRRAEKAGLGFEDRFAMLVERQFLHTQQRAFRNRLRYAGLSESGPCIEDINYRFARQLSRSQLEVLIAPEWIRQGAGWTCCSPLTDEKYPSFHVRHAPDGHWLFKDFSSGAAGTVIDLVQIKEKSPLSQAHWPGFSTGNRT